MIIPYPGNPQHTANLKSISLLEAQGWCGVYMSLEISLFEYDFAWRGLDEPDEYGDDFVFIYRITSHPAVTFDRLAMSSKSDLRKEYNWVDWVPFLSTVGSSAEEWDALPFRQRIFDLYGYYGYENIFGSSHWGGFNIDKS